MHLILFFINFFFEKNKEQFIKLSSVLSYTASHSTFDSINQEFGNEEFEAIHLCEDRVWCSFLSVFSLSSVLKKNVHLHYPDFGPKKYRLLWNSIISPRQSYDDCKSCLLYTSPSPRDATLSRMPSSA